MSYRRRGDGGLGDSGKFSGPGRRRPEEFKERDPKTLPESFGRGDGARPVEDNSDILQRMKNHYLKSPLSDLYECVIEKKKVKIWTRNYKEVRGVMTGYIIAFDKHWNVVLKDVDEVHLKPKKSKSPFLGDPSQVEFKDIPPKVPRQKKEKPVEPEIKKEEKQKRNKKKKTTSAKRQISQLFVRGDNIVMVCPFEEESDDEEDSENTP